MSDDNHFKGHHHDVPVPIIEWDEPDSAGFGGFRVVKNLDKFICPADWSPDPNDPSHFLPNYQPCKYRRLSKGVKQYRPWCKIHCLVLEDVVDVATCRVCDLREAPPQFVTPEQLTGLSEDETDIVDMDKAVRKELQARMEQDMPGFDPYGTQHGPASELLARDADPVFASDQPDSEYIKRGRGSRKKKATPWEPCVHREEAKQTDSDCGGCGTKYVCKCDECPLFNKVLKKKDCRECPHRKES